MEEEGVLEEEVVEVVVEDWGRFWRRRGRFWKRRL